MRQLTAIVLGFPGKLVMIPWSLLALAFAWAFLGLDGRWQYRWGTFRFAVNRLIPGGVGSTMTTKGQTHGFIHLILASRYATYNETDLETHEAVHCVDFANVSGAALYMYLASFFLSGASLWWLILVACSAPLAYGAASLFAYLAGGHYYWENWFEIRARRVATPDRVDRWRD